MDDFDKWYYDLTWSERDQIDQYSAAQGWYAAQALGIKIHDGQKLLVQHILDTEKGLSENSRKILEELIK